MRGSAVARIDDKGRLKIPSQFRAGIEDGRGPDVFVTSITGLNVRIYPMQVWLDVERKLAAVTSTHPTRIKFLDRVNYFCQTSELDSQGRIVIPQHLRESASIVGDVKVFGAIDYLDVWNDADFKKKLDREPWTDDDGLKLAEFLV